ncbi:hypothetical protein ACIBEJ_33240 [Nonomuraea sp. NPDC050790]
MTSQLHRTSSSSPFAARMALPALLGRFPGPRLAVPPEQVPMRTVRPP